MDWSEFLDAAEAVVDALRSGLPLPAPSAPPSGRLPEELRDRAEMLLRQSGELHAELSERRDEVADRLQRLVRRARNPRRTPAAVVSCAL